MKNLNKTHIIFSFTLSLLMTATTIIVIAYNYIRNLEHEVNQRDQLIAQLTESDKIISSILNLHAVEPNTTYKLKEEKSVFDIAQKHINPTSIEDILIQYNNHIQETNQLVNDYNSLVGQYNALLNDYNKALQQAGNANDKYKRP